MKSQKQSEMVTGRTIASKFQAMELITTLRSHLVSTQDGGNSSETEEMDSLSTREERLLMSQEVKILKEDTSLLTPSMESLTNNGTLSMKMNTLKSQRRENLTRSSVSMLIEISTLSHSCQTTDTLTSSTTETWSSRQEMEERPKSGTSINSLIPLEQD
jgi:hypothetical protein